MMAGKPYRRDPAAIAPEPAEVRKRTGPCHGWSSMLYDYSPCGHDKAAHAEPLVQDGHCTKCDCVGWDPMTSAEWKAVLNR